jgi:hypothetical protein
MVGGGAFHGCQPDLPFPSLLISFVPQLLFLVNFLPQ